MSAQLFVPDQVLRWARPSVDGKRREALILGNLTRNRGGHFCVSTAHLGSREDSFFEIRRYAATGQGEFSFKCAFFADDRVTVVDKTFHPDKFPDVPASLASLAAADKRPPAAAPKKPQEWIDRDSIATTKTGASRAFMREMSCSH
jgi:hypothetical protein